MSSSQISSSSSSAGGPAGPGPSAAATGPLDARHDGAAAFPFEVVADVGCPVTVLLGTGRVSVRDCLTLEPSCVLRLDQAAGEDLIVDVNGVTLARGELLLSDEVTSIRVTAIAAQAEGAA